MKVWLKVIGLCLLVLVTLGIIKAMEIKSAMAFGASFPEPSETVVAINPEAAVFRPKVSLTGKVQASQKVDIVIELPGRITQVGFESGQKVKKGQLLLKLDASEEEAQLSSAKARFTLALSIFNRHVRLIKTNAVSQEQYDQATASLATVKAEIAGLESIIDKKTLTAPFEGQAGLHQFEQGHFVAGGTQVTTIININKPYWVQFSLPSVYAPLTLDQEVSVSFFNSPTQSTANVIAISPQVDEKNLSTQYRAVLEDYSGADNQPVKVSVPVGESQQLVRVPVESLFKNAYGDWVYVLVPSSSDAEKVAVYRAILTKVGVRNKGKEWAMIASGLTPDMLIAGIGAYKLRDGILVYTQPDHDQLEQKK